MFSILFPRNAHILRNEGGGGRCNPVTVLAPQLRMQRNSLTRWENNKSFSVGLLFSLDALPALHYQSPQVWCSPLQGPADAETFLNWCFKADHLRQRAVNLSSGHQLLRNQNRSYGDNEKRAGGATTEEAQLETALLER